MRERLCAYQKSKKPYYAYRLSAVCRKLKRPVSGLADVGITIKKPPSHMIHAVAALFKLCFLLTSTYRCGRQHRIGINTHTCFPFNLKHKNSVLSTS